MAYPHRTVLCQFSVKLRHVIKRTFDFFSLHRSHALRTLLRERGWELGGALDMANFWQASKIGCEVNEVENQN